MYTVKISCCLGLKLPKTSRRARHTWSEFSCDFSSYLIDMKTRSSIKRCSVTLFPMNSMKLVIPSHSLYWSIHTKDESKRGTAFAFIFGVD